jgi:hypothetical protein
LELKTCFKLLEKAQWREAVLEVDGVHGGHGRSSGRGGVAWRVRRKAAGRIKAMAGRGATRGVCGEQEVALVRLQRRRAASKSGSGRWEAA